MKKKVAVLLTFALIIGLTAIGVSSKNKAFAKTAEMYLEIPESIKKENEFTVKVVLNSDVDLYSIDAYLAYNSDLLEFVPNTDYVTGASGVLELKDTYDAETKNAEYEITFRALDTGDVEVALTDVYLIDYADLDYIEVAPSAKHFTIGINKKVETDARLSDLLVAPGELTKEFQPEQLEYEMYVGLDVETIGVSAIPMEEGSIVGLEMPEKLQVGENTIIITVTALSGHVNTYTIKVYKEEISEDTETVASEGSGSQSDMSGASQMVTESEKITEEVVTEETTQQITEETTEEISQQVTEETMTENVTMQENQESEGLIEESGIIE